MSFFKKYRWFAVCSIIVVVLLTAALIMLVRSMKKFEEEKNALNGSMTRWQQLHSQSPYPSIENVRKEKENAEKLQRFYYSLNEMLRDGQFEAGEMEAAEFMPLLESTLGRMRNTLEASGVVFPKEFAFNFDKYAAGELPAPESIPRLIQQLEIVETLCGILADVGVGEVFSISREIFEAQEKAPRTTGTRRRGAPIEQSRDDVRAREQEADDMPYTTQLFRMRFRAREHVVMEFLNRLARHPMFIAVIHVEMVGPKMEARLVQQPTSGAKSAVESAPPGGRQSFLADENVQVALELEVYQFSAATEFR